MHYLHSERDLPQGVRVVLPSSFSGSPRAMQQNYQDAMAIVLKYGKPDLFLTNTCNPKICEIIENLCNNASWLCLQSIQAPSWETPLWHQGLSCSWCACCSCSCYWVSKERFASHILIILAGEDKLRERHDIEGLISAEIPDEEVDLELWSHAWFMAPVVCRTPTAFASKMASLRRTSPQTIPGWECQWLSCISKEK